MGTIKGHAGQLERERERERDSDSGYLRQASFNIIVRCLSITSTHQTEQNLLFYLILMTVYIGILLKLLGNYFWMHYETRNRQRRIRHFLSTLQISRLMDFFLFARGSLHHEENSRRKHLNGRYVQDMRR